MMRSLRIYALCLPLLLSVFIGAALLVGLRQAPSDWAKLLRLDDCQLPCWIGIEPGKTTLPEAERHIEDVFQDTSLYTLEKFGSGGYSITYKPTGFGLRTNFMAAYGADDAAQSVIYIINLMPYGATSFFQTGPGVAELYDGLGEVEGLQRVIGMNDFRLNLFFKNRQVDVFFDEPHCDKVNLSQGITTISISAQTPRTNAGLLSAPSPWQGFNHCHNLELRMYASVG